MIGAGQGIRLVALLGFALAVTAGGASAQDDTPPAQETDRRMREEQQTQPFALLAGPIDPARYRLGPGDVLSLEWTGRASRQLTVVVDAEGRVNLPELGVVSVGGRMLGDVRGQVLGRLRPLYPGARVDLRLVRVRSFKVYVSGQVMTPGVVAATGATRASELFHGPFALRDDGSRRNIELRRRDGTRLRVDLDAFALLGREEQDPYLEDGDVLLVPPRRERVYALGAFARPGEYELAPGDSVSDLVELAGGILPGTEEAGGLLVRFVSPTELDSVRLDLGAVVGRREDRALQHQDRLYARTPSDYRKVRNVTLFGESASRIVVSASDEKVPAVIAAAKAAGIPATVIGKTGGDRIRVTVDGQAAIDSLVTEAEHAWATAIERKMGAHVR